MLDWIKNYNPIPKIQLAIKNAYTYYFIKPIIQAPQPESSVVPNSVNRNIPENKKEDVEVVDQGLILKQIKQGQVLQEVTRIFDLLKIIVNVGLPSQHVEKVKKEIATLKEQMQDAIFTFNDNQKNQELYKTLNTAISNFDANLNTCVELHKQHIQENETREKHLEQVNQQKETLERRLEQINQQYENATREINALKTQKIIEDASKEEQQNKQIKQYKQQNQDQEKEIKILHQDIFKIQNNAKEQIDNLNRNILELKERINKHHVKTFGSDQDDRLANYEYMLLQNAALKQDKVRLEENVKDLQDTLGKKDKEIIDINLKLEKSKKELEQLTIYKTKTDLTLTDLQKAHADLQEKFKANTSSLAITSPVIQPSEDTINNLRLQTISLLQTAATFQKNISLINQTKTMIYTQLIDAQNNLAQAKEQYRQLKKEITKDVELQEETNLLNSQPKNDPVTRDNALNLEQKRRTLTLYKNQVRENNKILLEKKNIYDEFNCDTKEKDVNQIFEDYQASFISNYAEIYADAGLKVRNEIQKELQKSMHETIFYLSKKYGTANTSINPFNNRQIPHPKLSPPPKVNMTQEKVINWNNNFPKKSSTDIPRAQSSPTLSDTHVNNNNNHALQRRASQNQLSRIKSSFNLENMGTPKTFTNNNNQAIGLGAAAHTNQPALNSTNFTAHDSFL